MFLIAGLGNPGKEYENTRHNAGFMVLDALADKLGADISEKKHKALCGKAVIGGQKVILLKPQTYMNSSGESIRAAADYYKVDPEDILVVYDDISLAPGQLRIRAKGSAGGHNGIKSIIAHLGTPESGWAWEKSRPGWIWPTMCWDIFPRARERSWRTQ